MNANQHCSSFAFSSVSRLERIIIDEQRKIAFVVGGMAAVYVLVPLIDTALSRVNTKTLSAVCMVLVVSFAADMVYSHYVPNTGEGITDYDAYKETSEYCFRTDA